MASVSLVTDSTAYLPSELVERHAISVIPLYVRFGDDVYRDNVDMTPEQFYARLRTSSVLPATSQPSAGDFLQLYRRLIAEGAEAILSIHISSKLSGTVSSALMAREEISEVPIHIVDSLSTSMGQGYLVLEAARALEAGRPVEEVAAVVEERREAGRILFLPDTLEYLHKGGRIGGASAFLGSMLSIKPLLALREGRVEALERVRTKKRALKRLLDLAVEEAAGRPVRAAAIQAAAPEEGEDLRQKIASRLDCRELHMVELSPVLGTHTGPDTVGVVILPIA